MKVSFVMVIWTATKMPFHTFKVVNKTIFGLVHVYWKNNEMAQLDNNDCNVTLIKHFILCRKGRARNLEQTGRFWANGENSILLLFSPNFITHYSVSLHVKTQVITPCKSSFTKMAFKRLHAGMFSVMSCQFIGSGKLPITSFPTATVRLLSCVGSLVGL